MRCFTIALFVSLSCCAQNVQHDLEATKPKLIEPWKITTVNLLALDAAKTDQEEVQSGQVSVRSGAYQVIGLPAIFPGKPFEFDIVAIPDPIRKKICFIDSNRGFYVADKTAMLGCSYSGPDGGLAWCKSFAEIPSSSLETETAIAKFESEFDVPKYHRQWMGPFDETSSSFWMNLRHAAPGKFFVRPGSPVLTTKLLNISAKGRLLKLNIASLNNSMSEESRGTFYIDLDRRKVVKSIVNGEEMQLSDGNFAVPKQKR